MLAEQLQEASDKLVVAEDKLQRARAEAARNLLDKSKANYLLGWADEQIEIMTEAHTSRWRVGSVRIDPIKLTADLRRVVPSITVQQEGYLTVVYSTAPLTPEDFNRVRAEFQGLLNMDAT